MARLEVRRSTALHPLYVSVLITLHIGGFFSLSDSLRQRKLSGTLIHSCLLDLGPTTALECGLLCSKSN